MWPDYQNKLSTVISKLTPLLIIDPSLLEYITKLKTELDYYKSKPPADFGLLKETYDLEMSNLLHP